MIILTTPEELHAYIEQRLITENGKYGKCIGMFNGIASICVHSHCVISL